MPSNKSDAKEQISEASFDNSTPLKMKYTTVLTIWAAACGHASATERKDECDNKAALYEAPSWALTNVTRRKLTKPNGTVQSKN